MTTNEIDKKLNELARKELEQRVDDFIEGLKRDYPNLYNTHKYIETGAYCKVKGQPNLKVVFESDKDVYHVGYLLKNILKGCYQANLQKKKVNDLISKIEIFE
jgi:hypothetical protein